MITRLDLRNFKSWTRIRGMRMAPITGLFGPNSSGKTSIVQLLLLLKQTIESTDRGQVLNFGDERDPADLGTFKDVLFAHDLGRRLEFTVSWRNPEPLRIQDPERRRTDILFSGTDLSFMSSIRATAQGTPEVASLEYSLGENQFGLTQSATKPTNFDLSASANGFRFKRTLGRKWPLPRPVKFYGFPDQVRAYYQNASFLSELELAFERIFASIYYLGPLREYPQRQYTWGGGEPIDVGRRGESVVDALLASRTRGKSNSRGYRRPRMTLEEHIAVWLKELGLIDRFTVERISPDSNLYRVSVQTTSRSAPVLITDVGFGVSQILPVLVLCFFVPEGSTVILEQPEIHLHPRVQAGLADVLIEAARARRVQILVESHSEHLLMRLQRRVAEGEISNDELALYFVDHTGAESNLTPLDVDLWGSIRNWPKDFFGDTLGEAAATSVAAARRKASSQ